MDTCSIALAMYMRSYAETEERLHELPADLLVCGISKSGDNLYLFVRGGSPR
jgi:hypothetical protein